MILNQQFAVLLTCFARLLLRGGHPFTTEPLGKFQPSARHSCFPYTFLSFLDGHHFLRTPGQSRSILTNSFQHSLISEVKNVDVDLKKKYRSAHSDSTVVIQRGTKLVALPHVSQPPFLLSSGALLWSGHVPVVSIVSCSYNNKSMDKLQTLSLTLTPSHNIRVLASWINPPLNTDTEFHWAVHSKSRLCFTKESRFLF